MRVSNKKIRSTGKKFKVFHFSHMRFIAETDCKLSVSNGSFKQGHNEGARGHKYPGAFLFVF